MKITIDTREDSHEDIRKVIKMLQHVVGDDQNIVSNQLELVQNAQSPMANLFGDAQQLSANMQENATAFNETAQTAQDNEPEPVAKESTVDDIFAELFSEEELKKMDIKQPEEEPEEEPAPTKSPYTIEFY